MKKTQTSLSTLLRISERIVPFIALLIGIPLVVVVAFGLAAIYQQGFMLGFVALITVLTFLGALPLVLMRRQVKQGAVDQDLQGDWVQASLDWSEFDRAVWLDLNKQIQQKLGESATWDAMRGHALDLISATAAHYHPTRSRKELAFTVPEALRMTEEVSKRYRQLVMQHVPLIEKINLSTVRMVYDHRDKQETVQRVWNVYRFIRAFTPAGLIAEARGQLLDHVFAGLKDEVQIKLKQALLQEVASVAIDLYSGRFKITSSEIEHSDTFHKDQQRMAAPPEPLRVCLIGQVSAGKSSIVNALVGSMVAEVNQLPSTQSASIYQTQLHGQDVMHLVDLPGLDGKTANDDYLLNEIAQCDVVLWVLKANQSARALDTGFQARWQAWLDEPKQRSRRPPVMIGVLNQIDRLPPANEWQPPYDLQNPQTAKGRNIQAALTYNQQLLKFDTLIPLSVSEDKPPYNLETLQKLLDYYYEQGLQVQLNRRRLEAGERLSVQDQFKRFYRMGKSLFSAAREQRDSSH